MNKTGFHFDDLLYTSTGHQGRASEDIIKIAEEAKRKIRQSFGLESEMSSELPLKKPKKVTVTIKDLD